MAACTHGMPSPAACIECMAEGNIEAPPLPPKPARIGPVFAAKFPGECPSCDLPIHEGQLVQRWTDDRYRHAASHSLRVAPSRFSGCTP